MTIKTQAFKRCEIELLSTKSYENPFMDVDIFAEFTFEDGTVVKIPGFWNGENQWKVRFSSEKAGTWTYKITCTDAENSSLCDEGTIEVAPCLNPKNDLEKHGYVKLAPGKKHFVHADGTPFFYLADTHWMMPDFEHLNECNYPGCNCGNQFKHIADDRIKKGFNVYQTYFSSQRSSKGTYGMDGWWTDSSFTMIKPSSFNETMDVMMEYLAENGITVALGFGTHYSTVKGYKQNVTAMKAFAKYCIARYACYPLVWITAQEITNYTENAFDCWKKVGAAVAEYDGFKRPNGAHMHVHEFESPRSQELDKEEWHQWWTVQGGHGGYTRLRPRGFYEGYYKDDKMFIETENQYEDIYCSGFCGHDAPRMGAWQAVQLGSGGFTYGVTGIWVASWSEEKPALLSYSPEPWYVGIDKPGSTQVGFMRKFYEYINWYELEPVYDYKFGNFEDRRHVSISHKGNDVVVYYFFSNLKETGILTDLKPSTAYQARWFDPIVGKFIDAEDLIADENGMHTIPDFPANRDWILLLNDKSIDFGPYESYEYPKYSAPIAVSDAKPGEELEIKALKASSESKEHPATNLTDGNSETYWQGLACKTSQTITIDLGETKHFDYFYINCPDTQRYIRMNLMGSNDGEHFDLLSERTYMQIAIGGKYNEYYDKTSGDYRYVRFFLNSDENIPEPLKLSKVALFTEAK